MALPLAEKVSRFLFGKVARRSGQRLWITGRTRRERERCGEEAGCVPQSIR